MSLLRTMSVVSACLLATVSTSRADPVQLSNSLLDHVTAGAPVPAIAPIGSIDPIAPIAPIVPIGGVGNAPSNGGLPDTEPTPPSPSQLKLTSGGGELLLNLPTAPAGSVTEVDARITTRANGTSGAALVRVFSEGGGPIDLPGVGGSVVFSGD